MDLNTFERLYTAEQTRALDRTAIEGHGVPGITLMSRAANAAFDCLIGAWPELEQLQVLCGTGNNGGDGLAVARHLDGRRYDLAARRVRVAAEVDAFAEAWTSQSFFRRDPRQYEEIWLYELLPR